MIVTKEMKDRTDHYGHVIDFIFCLKCFQFIYLDWYEIGQEIKCPECGKDENLKW